jgi:DNA-directed RNA polymerase subunit RPC12/RpoP
LSNLLSKEIVMKAVRWNNFTTGKGLPGDTGNPTITPEMELAQLMSQIRCPHCLTPPRSLGLTDGRIACKHCGETLLTLEMEPANTPAFARHVTVTLMQTRVIDHVGSWFPESTMRQQSDAARVFLEFLTGAIIRASGANA